MPPQLPRAEGTERPRARAPIGTHIARAATSSPVMLRLLLTLSLLAAVPPATAAGAARGVERVGGLPETAGAISIGFVGYADGRDVMFVSTQNGLFAYDLTADPAAPRLLDHVTKEELMLPGDQLDPAGQGFWENEDMDVDPRRKLVFLSRDVLAFSSGVSGVHVVDAANPAELRLGRFVPLPHGHTSTCITACDYLWTTGAGTRGEVYVTDMRDPANPLPSPEPILTEDGTQSPSELPVSSHDVEVDDAGIAWVSGSSGVRGYRTSGDGATPLKPVLHGGGRIRPPGDDMTRGMHNSMRRGDLLFVTEEAFDACGPAGMLLIASLKGHTGGTAAGELPLVGAWSPQGMEGTAESGECTAHWFDMEGDLLVQSFYAQGTRFLDVSDPANPVQVAYFRPDDARAWAPYFHRGLIYVADNNRGVDILRRLEPDPVPPPAKPGAPLGAGAGCAPAAALGPSPRIGARGVRLRGTAACTSRVDVAVARVRGGRCRFLGRRGRLGRPRGCGARVWHRARGAARWSFTLRRRLARGSYTVWLRAHGAAPVAFRVRGRSAQREVVAPPVGAGSRRALRPSPHWGWTCPLVAG